MSVRAEDPHSGGETTRPDEHNRRRVHSLAYDPNEDPNANRLSFGSTLDGLTAMSATFTGEHGLGITQAIDARADRLYRRAVADRERFPDLAVPSRSTLRALALAELVREAIGAKAGRSPRVEATMVLDGDDPAVGSTPDGVRLADGTVRLLACDAAIRALVVDSLGVPLDLDRHVRWATEAQRLAAKHRDGGCVFPGCEATAAWCDVHHCVHDHDGGVTDLCNLVCLCRHHHGVVHRTGWSVRVDADGWAIITTPDGTHRWGQRRGREREGPPPDPGPIVVRPAAGAQVITGRYHRLEDPDEIATARQLTLARLARLVPA